MVPAIKELRTQGAKMLKIRQTRLQLELKWRFEECPWRWACSREPDGLWLAGRIPRHSTPGHQTYTLCSKGNPVWPMLSGHWTVKCNPVSAQAPHTHKLVRTHADDLVVEKKCQCRKTHKERYKLGFWLGHLSASAEPRAIHLSN